MKMLVITVLCFILIRLNTPFAYGWQASGGAGPLISVDKQSCLATPGVPVATAWSPDGSFLAAASNYGEVLTVWDKSGKVISQFHRVGGGPALSGDLNFLLGSSALVFSPQDDAADDDALSVWSIKSAKIIATIKGPQPGGNYQSNRAAVFQTSPDQRTLALATLGSQPNVAVYPSEKSKLPETFNVEGGVFSLSTFEAGHLVAIGSIRGSVSVIDVAQRSVAGPYPTYPIYQGGELDAEAIAGSPDGQLILVGLGGGGVFGPVGDIPKEQDWTKNLPPIWLLRVEDGKVLTSISGPSAPIRHAAWDPLGRFVAFTDSGGHLFLWQPTVTHSRLVRANVGGDGLALAISPDGNRIAVAADCGVQLFTVQFLK